MGALEDFYLSLQSEDDLSRLIRESVRETMHIEFKTKSDSRIPDLADEDRRNFSKSISAFANSGGGVLVWGIKTKKPDEVADKLKPIRQFAAFQSRLASSLLETVQPAVDGIELAGIASADDADSGYVKCLIPASDRTPHRAMYSREYYKRTTEGVRRLEHFDLEDMFGRRPTPKLALRYHLAPDGSMTGGGTTEMRGYAMLTIVNEGRGSARSPYLAVTVGPPYNVEDPALTSRQDGLDRKSTSDSQRTIFTSGDVVIHPEVAHEVVAIKVWLRYARLESLTLPPDLAVAYVLAAESTRLVSGRILVSGEEIARAVLPSDQEHWIPSRS